MRPLPGQKVGQLARYLPCEANREGEEMKKQKYLITAMTIIFISGIRLLIPSHIMAEVQNKFNQELKTATTSSQLEKLMDKYPDERDKIIPKLEETIVADIKSKGIEKRFFIAKIKPKGMKLAGRFSMKARPSQITSASARILDLVPDDKGHLLAQKCSGPFVLGDILIETEFEEDTFFVSADEAFEQGSADFSTLIYGQGSIHRFDGKVKRDGYTFLGEGQKFDRLTFVLIDQGYVYVRGKGRVISPEGKEAKLGY
jgi:hypothetical protein